MIETLCPWGPSTYLFFSENVPNLIHYSHLVAVVSALGIGLAIFLNNPRDRIARLLFLITLLFSIWAALDVILWATNRPSDVMFAWSLQVLLEPLTYILCFYLVYVFFYKRWPSFLANVVIFFLLLPLIIFSPTLLDLQALTLSTCEAIEGPLAKYYTYFVNGSLTMAIGFISAKEIVRLANRRERIIALCFIAGLVIFLLLFTSGNIISSFTDDWRLSQYGLFGMPIFSALIAYSIVRFGAFNVKVIATQMLVIVLALSVISLTTIQNLQTIQIVAAITFVLVCILGAILIRGVKREIRQREHIEQLAGELEKANSQQVILIHFITHQIKGFVAKSRNIFSMALEGDFGPVGPELKPMLQAGFDSDTKGATVIQEILNAANIKSGKVTYTMEAFDLAPLIQDMVNYHNASATEKNVAVHMDLGDSPVRVLGDRAQLMNVFKNVIDNSIKYTPQGEVNISLTPEPEKKMVLFAIKDTGVGITPEDKANLFTEGGHGKDSVKVNVESTGFGLYIVKQIVDAHKGRVWAESEGAGKGTQFYVELPAA